jgi:hypothetical protein
MISANSTVGNDMIIFNLGAGGPFTITLLTALPTLTDNAGCTIDGFNNSGNNGTPNTVSIFNTSIATPLNPSYMIVLTSGALFNNCIVCSSSNNLIKGLVIQNFGDGTPSNNDVAISLAGNTNTVISCYIGVDITGTTAGTLMNTGISITGRNNLIGDGTVGGVNLMAGMFGYGYKIYMSGATASANIVKGNIIGLQPNGTSPITNTATGIYLGSPSNTIGGLNSGDGNLISGNGGTGISIGSNSNVIQGNYIGPLSDGITGLTGSQQSNGMSNGGSYNIIGGSVAAARNLIAGNTNLGMDMSGSNNIIRGNYWGTNKSGTGRISTGNNGGFAMNSGTANIVGGTGVGDGNVISGFPNMGIWMLQFSGVNSNTIQQNIIGLAANGTSSLTGGGSSSGLLMGWNTSGNLIGGNTSSARNIISGNSTGISMGSGGPGANNSIKGNYIGIAGDGISKVTGASQSYGIYIFSGSVNVIGGTGAGDGNVISGNTTYGIYLSTTSASTTSVYQNTIGPQSNGTATLSGGGSGQTGIYITNSFSNTIGGTSSSQKNIISANSNGVVIDGVSGRYNKVMGNLIGPSAAGASIPGSAQLRGVTIQNSAGTNTIGGYLGSFGTNPQGNTIAYNTGDGIYIITVAADSNLLSRNLIYTNGAASKAINLNYGGSQGNGGKAPPVIMTVSPAIVTGSNAATGGLGDTVEVFTNTTGNCRDLMAYKGSTVADGAGNWTLTGITINNGESVIATARTVADNNTSEVSVCTVPLPVELSYLEAVCDTKKVRVKWKTGSEKNTAYFTVERTVDGNNFSWVGRIKAAGNSSEQRDYLVTDNQPPDGMIYYRITQTDQDGTSHYYYSNVVYDCASIRMPVSLFPNPASSYLNLSIMGESDVTVNVRILDEQGKEVLNKDYTSAKGLVTLDTQNLPKGFYVLLLNRDGDVDHFRFVRE